MKSVFINDIGIVSPSAEGTAELLAVVRGEKKISAEVKREFLLGVAPSKVRRCPRQVKMTVAAAAQFLEKFSAEEREKFGTLLTTGYGEVETMLDFTEPVLDGVPNECSPAKFSFTVFNSSLGQLCIVYGLKGPSTMLLGGDPLEYASLLFEEQKADTVICGAVEEYNDDLAESFRSLGILPEGCLSEAAVMLLIGKKPKADCWAVVTSFGSGLLQKQPWLEKVDKDSFQMTACEVMTDAAGGKVPDIVLIAGNGSYLDSWEMSVGRKLFPQAVFIATKDIFGETLGASYMTATALAAAALKEGRLEAAKIEKPKRVLVLGIDAQGNYLGAMLESVDCAEIEK